MIRLPFSWAKKANTPQWVAYTDHNEWLTHKCGRQKKWLYGGPLPVRAGPPYGGQKQHRNAEISYAKSSFIVVTWHWKCSGCRKRCAGDKKTDRHFPPVPSPKEFFQCHCVCRTTAWHCDINTGAGAEHTHSKWGKWIWGRLGKIQRMDLNGNGWCSLKVFHFPVHLNRSNR